eukprot:5749093-Prymnesium_polylepis.1
MMRQLIILKVSTQFDTVIDPAHGIRRPVCWHHSLAWLVNHLVPSFFVLGLPDEVANVRSTAATPEVLVMHRDLLLLVELVGDTFERELVQTVSGLHWGWHVRRHAHPPVAGLHWVRHVRRRRDAHPP